MGLWRKASVRTLCYVNEDRSARSSTLDYKNLDADKFICSAGGLIIDCGIFLFCARDRQP